MNSNIKLHDKKIILLASLANNSTDIPFDGIFNKLGKTRIFKIFLKVKELKQN